MESNHKKRILFLSAIDFKEKSIQVIRKTPEYYASAGWDVDYIVARDNVATGNYSYESEINPQDVNVDRFYWPLLKVRAIKNRYLNLILTKIASLIVIILLACKGYQKIKSNSYDVIYGYELQGVLALFLLKPFLNNEKIVTRFQGTFINEMLVNKQWLRLLFNIDLLLALKVSSDLTIMTDDGTEGDKALRKIRGIKKIGNIKFWPNGVNKIEHSLWPNSIEHKIKIISISRLVGWKRVDRCIKIVDKLVKNNFLNIEYEIIGGGELRDDLETMVKSLNLGGFIKFSGALPHSEALTKLRESQIFMSMYDSSNVGNPLLEAIRANKIIVTLDNGDTKSWITHKVNGFIYSPNDDYTDQAAKDIEHIIINSTDRENMLNAVKNTEDIKLWEWDERLRQEENVVYGLQ